MNKFLLLVVVEKLEDHIMIRIHPLGTINVSVKFNFDNVDTLQPGPKWWSATHKSASPELNYFDKVFFRVNTM